MVAISKAEITAATTAAGIPVADAAGIWPAAKAARDGAPKGTPEATRRGLAIAAATTEVGAKAPACVSAFAAALAAPAAPAATVANATPVAPTPAPAAPTAPASVSAEYADAVERALIAAQVPEGEHARRTSDFAKAIDAKYGLKEALNRLFEGLSEDAKARGRERFAELTDPWWKKGSNRAFSLFTTWSGRLQLGLLLLAAALLWWAPVLAKGWFILGFVLVLVMNFWFSDRKVLITVNLALVAMIAMAIFFGMLPSGEEWEFK